MLKVERLSFRYGNNRILNDISFEVADETMLAILGPNGSGKTTLIRCIGALLKPQAGTILLHEERIDSLSPEKMARFVAYMSQRAEVSGLTVFDTVLLGRKPHMGWQPTAADFEKVEQMLTGLNLRTKLSDRSTASVGERCKKLPWHAFSSRKRDFCCLTNRPAPWT